MATPALNPTASVLRIGIFDGRRQTVPDDLEVLITLRDGMQRQVVRQYYKASHLAFELPFQNNYADNYAVIAFADKYEQAGFYPVKLAPAATQEVDLMLLKKKATFHFAHAGWEELEAANPKLTRLLSAGTASAGVARSRYEELTKQRPAVLACFFNLVTAMAQIHLPSGTPLDYLKELTWEEMKEDRFFAYGDKRLVDQVRQAAQDHQFTPEPGAALFHPGATCSFKQVQLGEANVQITFHEDDTREVDGTTCVKIEADMDYHKDQAAHALLEVIPNALTGALTDPRQVYVLRWIAGRHAGIPEFNPPYTIE
ncbi:MAG: hypothetical protein ABSD27_10680 [Bryobacteraceae bacterium]|jgi:hypothetical protein